MESTSSDTNEKVIHSKVLVVDDEPAVLRLLQALLQRARYDVVTCRDSDSAMKHLSENSFDCIITDVIMPGLSGFEFVKTLRLHPVYGRIPILMLTRKRDRQDVKKAVEAGVSDYLVKPIDEQLLLDKVQRCMKKGQDSQSHIFELSLKANPVPAELQIACGIISVSETGLTIETDFPLTADHDFKLDNHLFEEMDLKKPILKFVNCERAEKTNDDDVAEKVFHTRLSFVGFTEDDLKKVRAWLRKEALRRRK